MRSQIWVEMLCGLFWRIPTRRRTLTALIFLFCVCIPSSSAGAQVKPIRRVLILYELGISSPSESVIDQPIRVALEECPFQVELYREYLETTLFSSSAAQSEIRDWYIHKYRNLKLDLVITVGPSPLRFVVHSRETSFRNIPVVFGGLSGVRPKDLKLEPQFTGVWDIVEPGKILEVALRLQPRAKHVVVVGGRDDFDLEVEALFRESLRSYESKLDITYLTNLAMPQLLEQLKHLPAKTIVLMTHIGLDAAGTHFIGASQADPLVLEAANAPVFGMSDVDMGHGEVGGYLDSFAMQGKVMGEMATQILKGRTPQNIPVVRGADVYMFDWQALKRWGLDEKNLPEGSIILNRQPAAWELYKWYIIAGIVLILVEAVLIFGLLWQRTRRRRAEAELGISSEQLRLAVATGRSAGWEWDINTGQSRWFGDLHAVFGLASDSYCGTIDDFQRRVHPADRDFVNASITNARQSRERYVTEFRVVGDNAIVRWITARGKFYYASNGNPHRMLGMVTDITDRKEVEQKLRESEQRFRLLANTAPVMIWTSGTNGVRKYFNKTWLDFTGRSLDQELGNGWTDGIHVEDLSPFLAVYVERFQAREQFELQYRLRRHDGEYRWISEVGIPRSSPDGTFAGYIGSSSDITERKMAEEILATVGRRLIEAHEEERTRIGRELHDDINQRLALLAVELDRWGQSASLGPDLQGHLQDARQRIAEIAGDVQALSHQLHSSKLEFLGLATAAKSFCKEISEKHQVRIDFTQDDVPRNLPKEISLCLFRILQEALQNAVKHSGTDHFEVRLARIPAAIRLIIRDYGRGFDVQEANRSLGLGLISMRERVGLVRGRIAITSKKQAGTEIAVQVPIDGVEGIVEAMSGAA
jgi:PAS domain S-box-containing protein